MIKKLTYLALACGMLAGCNKESPEMPDEAAHDGMVKMELRCNVDPLLKVETKAGAADDKVYRLDILEYDNNYAFQSHHTYTSATGLDLDNFIFEQWLPAGNTRYYALLANLHEDSINFIKSKPTNQWNWGSNAIPLSAGNWSAGHIPMGGWTYCYFNGSSPTATLRRYMFRIDIGTITADFGETLMAENVRVKSISIINANQLFLLANRYYSSSYGFSADPLGYTNNNMTSLNPFGGVTSGYSSVNDISSSIYEDTVWDYEEKGGEGVLAAEFTPLYNYNKRKAKHVLNITAPASIRDMCYYSVPSGSGTLAPTGTHVFSLNRSLYGVPRYCGDGSSYYSATGLENYDYQYDYMKLVIEVEVNSVSYFYPIILRFMQPNALYSISNITLKGPGSEYSNFFERQFYGNISAPAVLDWTDCTISNINVGYTDDTGTAIY